MITPPVILEFIRARSHHAITLKAILSHFNLPAHERRYLKRLLGEMVAEGLLVKVAGDRYKIPSQRELVTGHVQKFEEGYGFVIPEQEGMRDIFLPPKAAHGMMQGDRVLARVDRRGSRPSGSVVRVLDRAHERVVGKLERYKRFCLVQPFEQKIGPVTVQHGLEMGAREGQVVVVEITNYPTEQMGAFGQVVEVLGDSGDPEVEFRVVAVKHNLPVRFAPDTLAEAAVVPQAVRSEDVAGRKDLRSLRVVTIDGETARDFDDAVGIRRMDHGRFRLWVSIADVGHYVAERSALDREAYARGTSVYFPDRAIPMLPPELSSGICSLNPEQDRLALTVEMDFDATGQRLDARIDESAIQSRARMTYTEVAAILEKHDPEAIRRRGELVEDFRVMEDLARRILARRMARGSIDFDLPEAEIILDVQGKPEDIVRRERNIAHRIIEEFMLEANKAVAEFLTTRRAPMLYRIHEAPDEGDIREFAELAKSFGITLDLKRGVRPKDLADALRYVKGRPEEDLINHVMLRSMKQARYAPENAGHFGLSFETYCHFTSPIRRYPDLVVHRVLKEILRSGSLAQERARRLAKVLPDWGLHTSRRERVAMEAEREMVALKKVQFMSDKVGEEYDGFVSGVTKFGFFVELSDYFVEGLVPIRTLHDDEYLFHERLHSLVGRTTKRRIRLADRVRVRVDAVDLDRRRIDFSVVEKYQESTAEDAPEVPQRSRRGSAPSGGARRKKERPAKRGRKGKRR